MTSLFWAFTDYLLKKLTGAGDQSRSLEIAEENNDGTANDAIADPLTAYNKIKEVLDTAHDKCADLIPDDMESFKIYCSIMSMIHASIELDAAHPEVRENLFKRDGEPVKTDELETLCHYWKFAEWGYTTDILELHEQLRSVNYQLVRHDVAEEVGRVAHFIAVNHEKKEVVIAIQGTSNVSDVITDMLATTVTHSRPKEAAKDTTIRCHEGMYVAAHEMLEDTIHMIEHWFVPCNYKLIITGHSLGGGVSCLLGMLIHDIFASSKKKTSTKPLNLQVYGFATPCCLSYNAGLECRDFITCVVNNNDIVPRGSLLNVVMLNKEILWIYEKLQEKGFHMDDFTNAAKFFADLTKVDNDLLITPEDIKDYTKHEIIPIEKVKGDTAKYGEIDSFVPGRVISIWEKECGSNPESNNKNNTNEKKDSSIVLGVDSKKDINRMNGRVFNGGMTVLREFQIESNMVSDHLCDPYRQNLDDLLEKSKRGISL